MFAIESIRKMQIPEVFLSVCLGENWQVFKGHHFISVVFPSYKMKFHTASAKAPFTRKLKGIKTVNHRRYT